MLLWAHSALSSAHLAAGDVTAALHHAEQAARQPTPPDFHAAGQPGWCLGAALTAAGNPDRAVPAMLDALGGPELPSVLPADRPAASAAREAAADAPLICARALLAEGYAQAAIGDRNAAVSALAAAESALDGFGTLRRRDEAARELRRLGHRVRRPAREAEGGPLTPREREIAELAAAGRTNREIAEQLVLSTRTIEAHLRNIYGKLDIRSRVELARAIQGTTAPISPPRR
jgi:DNA-binding CsgD family transcriptional regulator